jgi:hypothetical protein
VGKGWIKADYLALAFCLGERNTFEQKQDRKVLNMTKIVQQSTKRLCLRAGIFVTLILLLALLTVTVQSSAAGNLPETASRSTVDGAEIIESDENGIIFEIVPPALQRSEISADGRPYQQIRLPGYGHLGLPGRPDLPQKSFLIALPPGAEAIATVLDSSSHEITGVNVLPAARQTLVNYDLDDLTQVPEFVTSYPADEAAYTQDSLFPTSPVSVDEPGYLRDQRVAWVKVTPVQANPARNSLLVFDRLQIQVRFEFPSGRPEPQANRPEGGAYEAILRDSLLNYEEGRLWREVVSREIQAQTSPCMDSNAFRIYVEETGIYELTHAALAAQGLPATVPSSKIRMCYESQEIAIRVIDGGDGTFGNGDRLVFYGQEIKTQETQDNVYWLTYSTTGSNGLRMAAAAAGGGGSTPSYYQPTYHLETDAKYYSLIPTADLNDHWYWREPLVGEPGNANQSLDVPFSMTSRLAGTYNFEIKGELWGWTVAEAHPFEVKLNGVSVGTGSFNGAGTNNVSHIFSFMAPSSALQNGNNTITIIALDNGNPIGHRMLVNWFQVIPRREFVAESNALAFGQPAAGSYTFGANGFTGGSTVEIYEVTDPDGPTFESKTAAGGTVNFNRTTAGATAYELVATTARLSPAAIVKDTVPNPLLNATSNQADYIIITDPSYNSVLTPLRNLRASQGLTVKTVYVQDIFDEFSYGIYSTEAIVDFLAYAYYSWTSPAPAYVLLAGEGSYDHRDVLGTNGPGGNLVPVYLKSGVDSNLGEAAADNQYVDVNGDDLADMLLGRLPGRSTAEMTVLVNKILVYENSLPNPGWRGNHFFVVDNGFVPNDCNMDPAGDFFASVNSFLANHFPDDQILRRLYYTPSPCYPNATYPTMAPYYATTITSMRNQLALMYNHGNQFVTYTGHAGTQTWGHENFLDINTVSGLTNGERTPVMLPMTCLEGIYHFPSGDNLSEKLLKSTTGGALASYAPTGLQVQHGHDLLLKGFYDGLFVNNYRILGQAVMQAKINLDGGPSFYQDLHYTFMTLGDPALKLNFPDTVWQNFLPASFK